MHVELLDIPEITHAIFELDSKPSRIEMPARSSILDYFLWDYLNLKVYFDLSNNLLELVETVEGMQWVTQVDIRKFTCKPTRMKTFLSLIIW